MLLVWGLLKRFWPVLVIAGCILAGWLWYSSRQTSMAKMVDELNASHQTELNDIAKARSDEDEQHRKQMEELQTALGKIQKDYEDAQVQVQVRQQQEVKQIVTKYGNDSVGLANLLSSRYGFTVSK